MNRPERDAMVQQWLDKVSDAFNLGAWTISITAEGGLADADGTPLDGTCDARVDLLHATIKVNANLDTDDADPRVLREVIFHEMLHIALAPIDEWYAVTVNVVVSKRWQRDTMLTAHNRVSEPVVVRLTRTLFPIVDAWAGLDTAEDRDQ